jgi:hypothetical protein
MKRALAGALTVIIMSLMIGAALWRDPAAYLAHAPGAVQARDGAAPVSNQSLDGPSRRVEGLLDCARRGDVAAYLGAFAGPLGARLAHEAQERGWAAFADQLRRAGAARKSHAIFAARLEDAGRDGATVIVESVYADRIERQTFRLTRDSGEWFVTDVDAIRDVRSGKPLGAVATYEEPEGVPVTAQ